MASCYDKRIKNSEEVVDGIRSTKAWEFNMYLKHKGITYRDMAKVMGLRARRLEKDVLLRGVTQREANVIYILTGEDISYMVRERV